MYTKLPMQHRHDHASGCPILVVSHTLHRLNLEVNEFAWSLCVCAHMSVYTRVHVCMRVVVCVFILYAAVCHVWNACVVAAGLLLRLFHLLYNCDVVEEEVYHSWKEDIAQDFPGKEKALFQVRGGRGREEEGWEVWSIGDMCCTYMLIILCLYCMSRIMNLYNTEWSRSGL